MAKKKSARKNQSLQSTIDQINEEYGIGTLVKASNTDWVVSPERIPTGCLSLDLAMGGGLPKGRITHLYGMFSSAKSSVLYGMIREAQSRGHRCALVVIEEFDPDWAQAHGVDLDLLDVAYPDSANAAVDIADVLVRSDGYGIVGYDSLAAGATLAMLERSATQTDVVGVGARLNNQFMSRLASALNAKPKKRLNQTAVVLINQMRVSFEGFHAIEKPTGGRAVGFHTAVGVKLGYRKSDDVYEEGGFFGGMAKSHASQDGKGVLIKRKVQFIVEKNKTYRPMLSGGFWFNAVPTGPEGSVGVDNAEETVRLGILCGIFQQAGAWITLDDTHRYQGVDNAVSSLQEEPALIVEFQQQIRNKVFDDPCEALEQEDPEEVASVIFEGEQEEIPDWEDLLKIGIEKNLIRKKGPAWLVWAATGDKFRKKEFAGLLSSTDWERQIRGTGNSAGENVPGQEADPEPGKPGKKQAKRGRPRKKTRRKKTAGKR